MPRVTKPLSDTEIKKAKTKDKTYKLADGKGLYLVVKNNGTKFFRFDYSFSNKRKSISFGIYPKISLLEAREKREEARSNIKEGIDPVHAKNIDRTLNNTFGKISKEWLNKMGKEWDEINYKKIEGMLRNHTLDIQNTDISKINRIQIINIINKLQSKNLLETAKRLLSNIERIYKYAVTYGYTEHNIVADIDKKNVLVKQQKNHFPAITDEEGIKQLMRDIKSYSDDFRADSSTVLALELSPYLFLRPFNIRFLEWDEVDLEKEVIDISGKKMKTGKDFIIPLPSQAIEILKKAYMISHHKSKFVFPSQITNLKPISENTLNQALTRLGYKDKMVAHGFRAMFSSIAHDNISVHGHHSDVIELCLAHAEQNQVKAAYNRENKMKHFDERKDLIKWYADWLDFDYGG
ncbi:MAG: integrase arm-type DNA-binding domain-containing protein [Helicobacteraceae bacterium]|nr:integrase arm-type DNA-binding domain-containing protein [Helicobacteraceae bacterium]